MRFIKGDFLLSRRLRNQIFLFLSASPVIVIVLLAFIFYKLFLLAAIIAKEDIPRNELLSLLDDFHRQIFFVAIICVVALIVQVIILLRFIHKIIPRDSEMNITDEDKEILSQVEIKDFNELKTFKSNSVEKKENI